MVEYHCLQAMKIVHHYVNSCFDWLTSEQQNVNPWREAISLLSVKYKRFTFVHPVSPSMQYVEQFIKSSQLTFLEFYFETEAKVDFPSVCIQQRRQKFK